MKNLAQGLIVLFSLACGLFSFATTENLIAASAATYVASYGLQVFTGVGLTSFSSFSCVLAALKTTACGEANPGGGFKVWVIAKDQFVGNWGHIGLGVATIMTAPTLADGAGFVELEVADNSLKLDQSMKGAVGYQSFETSFEVKVAGDFDHQTLAVRKLLNTEVVAVIQLNDLQRKSVGSTIFPLTFEISHTTGAKGSDQRGWTLKAKQDGLPLPCFFIDKDVVLPLLQLPTIPPPLVP